MKLLYVLLIFVILLSGCQPHAAKTEQLILDVPAELLEVPKPLETLESNSH